jgi:hypothetical protein
MISSAWIFASPGFSSQTDGEMPYEKFVPVIETGTSDPAEPLDGTR